MRINNKVLTGIKPISIQAYTSYSYTVGTSEESDHIAIPSLNGSYAEIGGIPVYFNSGDVNAGYTSCAFTDIDGNVLTIQNVTEEIDGIIYYNLQSTYKGNTLTTRNLRPAPITVGFYLESLSYRTTEKDFTAIPVPRDPKYGYNYLGLRLATCKLDEKHIMCWKRGYTVDESRS